MKNNLKKFYLLLITFMSVIYIAFAFSQQKFPTFIGIDKCRKCHSSNQIGNQIKIWSASPHAKAYHVLMIGRARKIAKKFSISTPHNDVRCLKCHTTGGGKSEATKTEGVGCEACHGPGSKYYEFSNHASFVNRDNSYKKAIRLGMYPIIGIDSIKLREKLCKSCHSDKRPCIPTELSEKKRQQLPLSLIADFIFRHSVHR